MGKLPEKIIQLIDELGEVGSDLYDEGDYEGAIGTWGKALDLIPEPRNRFAESQWLETSIGDAYFLLEDNERALEYLLQAKRNIESNAYESPFLMLRLGQALLETGQQEDATQYLLSAYMFEGEELFAEEDGKYLEFLRSRVDLG